MGAYKPEEPGERTWKEPDPPAQFTHKLDPDTYGLNPPPTPKEDELSRDLEILESRDREKQRLIEETLEGLKNNPPKPTPPGDQVAFGISPGEIRRISQRGPTVKTTGMVPGGQFGPKDESPLVREIRRAGEIEKQQLREKAERDSAIFEARRKRWLWNAWWRAKYGFLGLFKRKESGSKAPKAVESPREKVKGTDVIAILIAFVALPVAMNTNDPLTAYVAYAVAWLVLMYLCFSHHATAIWRVIASIAITLLLWFFCYRYWVTHQPIPDSKIGEHIQVKQQPAPVGAIEPKTVVTLVQPTPIASDIDKEIKDAGFDVPAVVSSIQAGRLRDLAEEKEAEAAALKMDAKLLPAIKRVLDTIKTVTEKSQEAGWVKVGDFKYLMPERSIYSYTYLNEIAGKIPNSYEFAVFDIAGARWRIWLGYGNTRTTAQRFNTSETGNIIYPVIFIMELRGNQAKQIGTISFDPSLEPTIAFNDTLLETRERVLLAMKSENLSGYPLLEKYILELIKDTQIQTALLADKNAS